MTHTINAVVWGDTGIVVGGIPVPDSAGFQQVRLAQRKPGERLPNDIADFLVLDASGKPVLAGGSIGTSLQPEVLRIVVSAIAQRQALNDIAAAPALLINPDPQSYALPLSQRAVLLPQGGFDPAIVAKLKAAGVSTVDVPAATVAAIRGTVALIGFEGARKSVPEVPGVMVFGGAE